MLSMRISLKADEAPEGQQQHLQIDNRPTSSLPGFSSSQDFFDGKEPARELFPFVNGIGSLLSTVNVLQFSFILPNPIAKNR